MKAHKSPDEQAACDADYENYVRLSEEADEKALAALGDKLGKTTDEIKDAFKEMAKAIWEAATIGGDGADKVVTDDR